MGLFSGFFTIVDAFINGEIHGGEDSLRVTSPDSIKGTYDSAIGSFGIPQYGGSMAGRRINYIWQFLWGVLR
jgi:hypothetical protein